MRTMICRCDSSGGPRTTLVSFASELCGTRRALTKFSAIWDNRSAFHTATHDYEGLGERFGNRAVGIGEVPYLDPSSRSRTEVLGERQQDVEKEDRAGADATTIISA